MVQDTRTAPARDAHAQARVILRAASLEWDSRLQMSRTLAPDATLITEVAIIGAGPQGMQAAFALAEAGRAVAVLEHTGRWGGGFFAATAAVGQAALITPIQLGLEPAAQDALPPFTLAHGWRAWLDAVPAAIRRDLTQVIGDSPPVAPLVALWQQIRHYIDRYGLDRSGYRFTVRDVCMLDGDDGLVTIIGTDGSRVLASQVILATGNGQVRHGPNHHIVGHPHHPRAMNLLERRPARLDQRVQPGERALIIGAGNSAATWALALADEGLAEQVIMATRAGCNLNPPAGAAFPTPEVAAFRQLSLRQRADLLADLPAPIAPQLSEPLKAAISAGQISLRQHTGEVTRIDLDHWQGRERCVVRFADAAPIICDRVFFATGFAPATPATLYGHLPSLHQLVQRDALPTFGGYAVPDGVFWAGSRRRLIPLCRAGMLWFPPQPIPAAQQSHEILAAIAELDGLRQRAAAA